jgi:AcrR family transcriptional regulator
MSIVGRPREHNEETAARLLMMAERVVEAEGQEALSMRRLAAEAETTTRAVYSLFGSRDGLLAALGTRAYTLLGADVAAVAVTDDPAADLVEAGLTFRTFATAHPALFALAVQMRTAPGVAAAFKPARMAALMTLKARIEHLEAAGLVRDRSVRDAIVAFHALCEGLAALELRGTMPKGEARNVWRGALSAIVMGFASPTKPRSTRAGRATGATPHGPSSRARRG